MWQCIYMSSDQKLYLQFILLLYEILISKSLNNVHAIRNCKGKGHQYYLNCCVFLCCASVGMLSATQEL